VETPGHYPGSACRVITALVPGRERNGIVVKTQYDTAGRIGQLTGLQWVAVALVVATGALHVFAGVVEARPPVLLAGGGYAGALVLFFLGYRRRLLYLVGIPYTAVQFPLWLVAKSEYGVVGYADKAVQVALILVLVSLYLNTPSGSADGTVPSAD
jgi:hypothetical protein